jgi:hypothetical protein
MIRSGELASDLLGLDLLPRISGRAEISPTSIGHFLLFLTSFLSGCRLLASQCRRDRVVRAIRHLALCRLRPDDIGAHAKSAAMGAQDCLSWQSDRDFCKPQYGGDIGRRRRHPWFCSAWLLLQSSRFSSIRLLLLIPSNGHVAFKLILRAAGFVCFIALLLNGSRGGLICTCLGLLAAIGLIIAGRLRPNVWYALGAGTVALVVMIAWLSETGRIGSEGVFDQALVGL